MTKRSRTPILLVCVAVCVACGSERGVGPEPEPPSAPERPPVFTTLEVGPTLADLFTGAPGNTVQLSIGARDQTGAPMASAGAAEYWSSAPWIAGVSGSGVVTAVAPGKAVITAALTLGRITRTASMTATVRFHDEGPGESSEFAGVYDLTALITSADPAWGIEDGTRQTAVITIQHYRGAPRFTGTFTDFCAIDSTGKSCSGNPGFVTGTIDPYGGVVIELFSTQSQESFWYGQGALASRQIVGTFGCCGHISGTFTAERRQVN